MEENRSVTHSVVIYIVTIGTMLNFNGGDNGNRIKTVGVNRPSGFFSVSNHITINSGPILFMYPLQTPMSIKNHEFNKNKQVKSFHKRFLLSCLWVISPCGLIFSLWNCRPWRLQGFMRGFHKLSPKRVPRVPWRGRTNYWQPAKNLSQISGYGISKMFKMLSWTEKY